MSVNLRARLEIEGRDAGLAVLQWHLEEALSRPFVCRLQLVSKEAAPAPTELLGRSACLTVELGEATRQVSGLVSCFEPQGRLSPGHGHYAMELTPRLWLLSLSRERQVYGPDGAASVVEVLRANLLGEGALGVTGEAAAGLAEADVSFRLQHPHPARDFIVQHEESDLAFVSRLMEHEGIFYFFEQGAAGERLVLADDSSVCLPCPGGPAVLPYRPVTALARPEDLTVAAFSQRSRLLPAGVVLKDYNPALPTVDLEVRREVAGGAHGVQLCYGDNYRSRSEGEALAAVRATELACRRILYSGQTTAPHFMPGGLFSLDQHPEQSFNQSYLVTALAQEGWQSVEGVARGEAEPGCRTRFEAIPADVAFAPERRAPRPRIAGLTTGWVEGSREDQRGELDGQGCYRVRLDDDLSGRERGKASPPLRRIQPLVGANAGIHLPLPAGTEVALCHVNGDPDRPLILGAVDNPQTTGVLTERSRTVNRIRTPAGTTIEMNDGLGNPGLASAVVAALGRWSLAGRSGESAAVESSDPAAAAAKQQRTRQIETDTITTDATYLRFFVLDVADEQENYLRLGSYEAAMEQKLLDTAFPDLAEEERNGIFFATDGAEIAIVDGEENVYLAGNQRVTVVGAGDEPRQELVVGDATTPTRQKVVIAGDQEVRVGGSQTASVTGNVTLTYKENATVTTKQGSNKVQAGNFYEVVEDEVNEKFVGNKVSIYMVLVHKSVIGAALSTKTGSSFYLNFAMRAAFTACRWEVTGVYLAFATIGTEQWVTKAEKVVIELNWTGVNSKLRFMNGLSKVLGMMFAFKIKTT